MQLRELTKENFMEEFVYKADEDWDGYSGGDPLKIACATLKLASQALCFHCRDKGDPQKTKTGWLHYYSENHSAVCKAAAIWEAPILTEGGIA